MGKARIVENSEPKKRGRPAISIEARENQLASYAMDLVEKRLLEGTASSQETTHFLKLVTTKALLEKEKLERENELLRAKTKALQATEHSEEMYTRAIEAMKRYSGHGDTDDEDY